MTMIELLPPYLLYFMVVLASFLVSLYAVRKIIFITRHRRIFDIPDNTRKIHGAEIPSLGGIGVFVGYIVIAAFFMFTGNSGWNYILISSVILFFTGIYDDLMNMRPLKKLFAQLVASAITVYFTLMPVLTHTIGPPPTHLLPYWIFFVFLTTACTFFINAFNFIDGIDGLACIMAIFYAVFLGILFTRTGADHKHTTEILFSIAGATAGLLYYNRAPAKIYMGDTGSMFLGFNIFTFAALYLFTSSGEAGDLSSELMLILSILFLPIYDAIRVFILRMSRGKSPLKADRTHLHYYLLDAGFTHTTSVLIILGVNIAIVGVTVALKMASINPLISLLCMTFLASVALYIIYRLRQKNLPKKGT